MIEPEHRKAIMKFFKEMLEQDDVSIHWTVKTSNEEPIGYGHPNITGRIMIIETGYPRKFTAKDLVR